MKKVEITLYEYDELSDKAKERARLDYAEHFDYGWDADVRKTIEAYEREFGVKVRTWRYGPYDHSFDMRTDGIDDEVLALRGNRARAWFWNNHGAVLLEPRKTWWYRDKATGKWREGLLCGSGEPNPVRRSKVFFERVYDGTCPWTGMCFDNDALDPIAYFCFGVRWDPGLQRRVPSARTLAEDSRSTVGDLLRAGMDALLESASSDWAYQVGEDGFREACAANGWTFEENGEMRNA